MAVNPRLAEALRGASGLGGSAAAPVTSGQEAVDQLNAARLSSALRSLARLREGEPQRRARVGSKLLPSVSRLLEAYFAEHQDDPLRGTFEGLAARYGRPRFPMAAGSDWGMSQRAGVPVSSYSGYGGAPDPFAHLNMWQPPSPSGGGVSAPQVPVATLAGSSPGGVQATPFAVSTPVGPMLYPPVPTNSLFGSRDPRR